MEIGAKKHRFMDRIVAVNSGRVTDNCRSKRMIAGSVATNSGRVVFIESVNSGLPRR